MVFANKRTVLDVIVVGDYVLAFYGFIYDINKEIGLQSEQDKTKALSGEDVVYWCSISPNIHALERY
ncbi:hypothetical protein L2E82_44944 [Cichorium intybus]|uniref:Uncharacterized protein n=1 Tax=Cichorium intybus TaxID=13427 RepID=A0ACB8ZRQ5_CICIN|nr:hypothetical protein L2E82_44944 [Cichorium intybus]